MNSLVILAGGLGERAKQKDPKQFLILNSSKNVRLMYLQYPYLNQQSHNFEEIIVVVPKKWQTIISKEIKQMCSISKVISGGENRTESSYLGLKACSSKCKKVLIHDAARPFASKKLYTTCIKYLDKYDAVIPIIDTKDTSIYIESSKKQQQAFFLSRDSLKAIQTPQAFNYNIIKDAYNQKTINKTDDLQILLDYQPKAKIRFINGEQNNFKITTKQDIKIIQALYNNNKQSLLYE
tara:strand:- start:2661 stop:3371 length:711 start_codon:yes stop_codon:yes gene_type:complete